jgi:putative transposase
LITDDRLLELIKADLEKSPFTGEGHRKVWARLKYGEGFRISRKRVLRLMREHNILSPYRQPLGELNLHAGEIVTAKPNEMRVLTGQRYSHWKTDMHGSLPPLSIGMASAWGSM